MSGLRVGVPGLFRSRLAARPLDAVGVIHQLQLVASVRADVIEKTRDLPRDIGAAYHESELAVGARRTRIHVHRSDEHGFLVDHQRLGVQTRGGTAEWMKAGALLSELGPHFGQL